MSLASASPSRRRSASPAPRPAAAPAKCGLSLAPVAGTAGTAWALSSAARAERTADTATVSRARSASRRACSSRGRISLSRTPVTLGPPGQDVQQRGHGPVRVGAPGLLLTRQEQGELSSAG
jgi:hypothetical protein